MAEILPGPPVAQGKWENKIGWPHLLIPMQDGKVLDWHTEYGFWWLWSYDPLKKNDVLPDPALKLGGSFPTFPIGRLLKMIDGRVLQWDGLSGEWWLRNYDAKAPSGIYSSLQASGKWDQIVYMGSPKWHELVPMPDGKVLDWVYHEGSYRLWNYAPLFSPNVLPTVAAEGQWGSKLSFDVVKTPRHELVAMPDGRVLDWVTKDGSYRLWNYEPQSKKDIFPGAPAEQGKWGKDKWGMSVLPDELVVMADGRILVWARATGEWSLWEYELPERPEGASRPFQLDRWFAEADPLSKVISMSLYATLTKPRPPVSRLRKDVASLVSGLTPAERRRMTDRLKQIRAHLKVVDAALKTR